MRRKPIIRDMFRRRGLRIDRSVSDELLAGLRAERGYSGALHLRGQTGGPAPTIAVFQTELQAHLALSRHASFFRNAGRRLLVATSGQQREHPQLAPAHDHAGAGAQPHQTYDTTHGRQGSVCTHD